MSRRIIILLIPAFLIFLNLSAQYQDDDTRLLQIVREYGQAEIIMQLAGPSQLENLSRNVSILNVSGNTIEVSLSRVTVNWFLDQHYTYSIKEKVMPRGLVTAHDMASALTFDIYPTYTQYDSIMQSFVLNYPSLCTLDTIGTSINGRLILALGITGSVSSQTPEVFYTSTMHGNETGGFILMLRLADYLLKNYESDAGVRELMDNLRIWINPLSNPDGTYNNGDTINNPVRYNADGVDLNRNFPDPLIANQTLEKENIEMISFMRKHRFVISANFHSGEEVVNYPWDRWLDKLHADDTWFHDISRAYADTVHQHAGAGYMTFMDNGITRGSVWYVVYGGRQDFVTQYLQGREVTIELHDTYVTPASQLSSLWEANRRSLLYYLGNALYGVHGKVIDSASEEPVLAEVFIKGHDKDSSQVYSDPSDGTFVRMIDSGTWPLTFSASGYRDTTINVTVASGERTDLTVLMKKGSNTIDSLPAPPALYPNPASAVINVLLPEPVAGEVEIIVTDQAGRLVIAYTSSITYGIPFTVDISSLSQGIYQADFRNIKRKASCRGRFVVIK